jgi:hypothetical protein
MQACSSTYYGLLALILAESYNIDGEDVCVCVG